MASKRTVYSVDYGYGVAVVWVGETLGHCPTTLRDP
jgi:hypothetical protein